MGLKNIGVDKDILCKIQLWLLYTVLNIAAVWSKLTIAPYILILSYRVTA